LYIAEQVVEIETCDVEEDIVSEEEDYTAEQVTGCYTFNAKAIAGLCTLILIALGIALYSVLKPVATHNNDNYINGNSNKSVKSQHFLTT
jgi:hypothetical protein